MLNMLAVILIAISPAAPPKAPPAPSWDYVRRQLKLAKFGEPFINELGKQYEAKDFEEVVRLNVLLFLKKSDIHGVQITDQAIQETAEFYKSNKTFLDKAQSRYGVSGKVVASLLWIESRYGKNSGHFHVPSVYLHLVQAPRAVVQKYLLTQTGRYSETPITASQTKDIIERTHKKAKFAFRELHALERAYKWKWKMGTDFRGSYSGAFGMPQFLPSSYIQYARATDPSAVPELDQPNDAIFSVAFYLRQHGWNARDSKARVKALLGYNNSLDYANAILSLSEKI